MITVMKVVLFILDFILENMENYKGPMTNDQVQWPLVIGPEDYGKYVIEIDENFGCLLFLTKIL
jgi:hypothetical protein